MSHAGYFDKPPTVHSFSTKKDGGTNSVARTKRSGRTSKNRSKKQATTEATADEDDSNCNNQ